MADLLIVNKVDTAEPEDVATVEANVRSVNPRATILRADSPVTVEHPECIKGKRVLVIEDFPATREGGGWTFESTLLRFTGPKGKELTIGQQHQCHIANVDMERQMVDFKFIE